MNLKRIYFVTSCPMVLAILSACTPKNSLIDIQNTKATSENKCKVRAPDRTANSLQKLADQHNLQKTHTNVKLSQAALKKWVSPITKVPPKKWRLFGVISTPLEQANGGHEGVDIEAALGTPVLAASAGTVVYTLNSCRDNTDKWCGNGWGNHVVIDHGDGVFTRYAHLNKNLIALGSNVEMGKEIGKIGFSGLSDSEHLHFELGYKTSPFDPCKPPQSFKSTDETVAEYGDEGVYDPKLLFK